MLNAEDLRVELNNLDGDVSICVTGAHVDFYYDVESIYQGCEGIVIKVNTASQRYVEKD